MLYHARSVLCRRTGCMALNVQHAWGSRSLLVCVSTDQMRRARWFTVTSSVLYAIRNSTNCCMYYGYTVPDRYYYIRIVCTKTASSQFQIQRCPARGADQARAAAVCSGQGGPASGRRRWMIITHESMPEFPIDSSSKPCHAPRRALRRAPQSATCAHCGL